ncbi:MAG: hypothetical protein AAGK00_11665 [Pseudomonadota bacterium]
MRFAPAMILALALSGGTPAPTLAHDLSDQAQELGDALRDFLQQMEPTLDDAMEFFQQFEGIDDPRHYDMPEVLPNGDIIIRRSPDAPPFDPAPEAEPATPSDEEGTIDL